MFKRASLKMPLIGASSGLAFVVLLTMIGNFIDLPIFQQATSFLFVLPLFLLHFIGFDRFGEFVCTGKPDACGILLIYACGALAWIVIFTFVFWLIGFVRNRSRIQKDPS